MRKNRNSLAELKSYTNHSSAYEEEVFSQDSSSIVRSQGESLLERYSGSEEDSSGSSTSVEYNDNELSEQKCFNVGSKGKKPIPKPRKHIPKQESHDGHVNVLGVNIRQTSTLEFKKFIRAPRVRVSIVDQSTGQFAKKSKSGQNVVFNNEPESLDYILPIISTRGKMSSEMSFSWNEIIVFNDTIEHLLGINLIMFFEIIDLVPDPMKHAAHKKVFGGWYHACWAFIRLSSQKMEDFGRNLQLQLHKYKNLAKNSPIFQQWAMQNLKKYPGTLEVNFTSIVPKSEGIGLLRPFTALETDKKLPLLSPDNIKEEKEVSEDLAPTSWIKTFDKIRRKSFEAPIAKISEFVTNGGSTVCRFSPDGRYVAYSDNSTKGSTIVVKFVHNLKKSLVLRGHTNVIHSLNWWNTGEQQSNKLLLVSSSEDQSCIIWRVEENSYVMQHVLPHPCFLYCSIYISNLGKGKTQIITGGRDCIVRVWNLTTGNPRILQELHHHSTYIVGMAQSNILHTFLSVDNHGKIIEWGQDDRQKNWNVKRQFNTKSTIKQFYLHPLATNAYALLDRALVKIDLQSGLLQWPLKNFICTLDAETFSISESGANIFLATNTEIICIHQFSEEILCKIRLKRGPRRTNFIDFCSQNNFLAVSLQNNIFGGECVLFGPETKQPTEITTVSKTSCVKNSNGDGPYFRNSTFNEILNKLEDILKVKRNVSAERRVLLKQSSKAEEPSNPSLSSNESENLTYSIQRSGTFIIDKKSKENDRSHEDTDLDRRTYTMSLKSLDDLDNATEVSEGLPSFGKPPNTQRSNRTVIFYKEFKSEDKS